MARREHWERRCAPAATDKLAPKRSATRPEALRRPLSDAEIDDAAGSWRHDLVQSGLGLSVAEDPDNQRIRMPG